MYLAICHVEVELQIRLARVSFVVAFHSLPQYIIQICYFRLVLLLLLHHFPYIPIVTKWLYVLIVLGNITLQYVYYRGK